MKRLVIIQKSVFFGQDRRRIVESPFVLDKAPLTHIGAVFQLIGVQHGRHTAVYPAGKLFPLLKAAAFYYAYHLTVIGVIRRCRSVLVLYELLAARAPAEVCEEFFLERAQRHIAPVARFKYAVADAVVVYAVYLSRGGGV